MRERQGVRGVRGVRGDEEKRASEGRLMSEGREGTEALRGVHSSMPVVPSPRERRQRGADHRHEASGHASKRS